MFFYEILKLVVKILELEIVVRKLCRLISGQTVESDCSLNSEVLLYLLVLLLGVLFGVSANKALKYLSPIIAIFAAFAAFVLILLIITRVNCCL